MPDTNEQLEHYRQEMRYMHIEDAEVRIAPPELSTNLMSLATKRALVPAVFDEYPPFFFGGQISNDKWDSYESKMGQTSLQNYADGAQRGVPYLRSHNTRGDPIGYSLAGAFDGKRVRAEGYMMTDTESTPYIVKIKGGVITDQSIGFAGGEWMCTICGKDMDLWWTADGCQHILGMMYPQTDKKGNVKQGAPEIMARAIIENAALREISGVYLHATPDAIFDKARAFSDAGQLEQRHIELIKVRYNVPLPAQRRVHPVAKRDVKVELTDEEVQALRDSVTFEKGKVTRLEAVLATVRGSLALANLPADRVELPLDQQITWLATERVRLAPLADDGTKYRHSCIEATLLEGTRAYGDKFNAESIRLMLNVAPIDSIMQMQKDYTHAAESLFPKGRQTGEGNVQAAEKKKVNAGDAGFRG